LNIKVVAEGVETEEQLRFLLRRKCDEAQGYFIARPLPPEEIFVGCANLRQQDSSPFDRTDHGMGEIKASREIRMMPMAGRSMRHRNQVVLPDG